MKKLTSIVLIIATLVLSILSLASCTKNKYTPVESTAEEKKVVMTLSIDSDKYEVKYEIYRALFLELRDEVYGGDRSVWSVENKAEYIEKILQAYSLVGRLSQKNGCEVLHLRNRKSGADLVLRSFPQPVGAYEKIQNIRHVNLPEIYDVLNMEDGQIVLR